MASGAPACYSSIATIKDGREEAVRAYGKQIEVTELKFAAPHQNGDTTEL
ncbi:hypothetical protein [Mycobacterium colombiense]|nr:hypothetical protein [Mycobacterium colombiense]